YGGEGPYTRTHIITVVDEDTFTIPVAFVDDHAVKGVWTSVRITSVSPANARGTAEIGPGGSTIVYTPEVNFVGDEVFAYTLEDSLGNVDRGLVSVHLTLDQLNGNLQANHGSFSAARGLATRLDVLANANRLPATGASLQITRIVTPPALCDVQLVDNQILSRQLEAGPFP